LDRGAFVCPGVEVWGVTDLTLDPSITADELNDAMGATPAPFPDVDFHDDADQVHGLTAVAPATPAEAIANARQIHENNVFVDVGMCLATVRRYFEVPALWPDAATAWEHSSPRHNAMNIPGGAVIYWVNGRHGHVALSVGGGLCWTTDYRRNGFVDLAPIANLASWCGGTLAGWGETLNGFDVWPDPKKPKPEPAPWGLEDKRRLIAAALKRAKAHGAPERRIDGLTKWLDRLDHRIKKS
jgi:hypothetical protein